MLDPFTADAPPRSADRSVVVIGDAAASHRTDLSLASGQSAVDPAFGAAPQIGLGAMSSGAPLSHTHAVAMTLRRWTLLLYFVAEAAIIVVTMRFGQGVSIQPAEFSVTYALLAAWWVMPAGIVALQRSPVWLAATAALMVGASVAFLFSLYTSESSTVAIGFLTIPILRIGCALGALLVAAAFAKLATAWEQHHDRR